MSLLMIHEAYMPVYRCPDFHCVVRAGGFTRGSTRGPRGPKNAIESFRIFIFLSFRCSVYLSFFLSVILGHWRLIMIN